VAGEVSITVDNATGVTLALDHLVALGHRSIAYVYEGGQLPSWEHEQRRAAYRRFVHAHGLPHGPSREVAVLDDTIEAAQDAVRQVLNVSPPPTAVFVNTDLAAILILKAALMYGFRVPGDLSVVGFDDIAFSALCTPGLTTVHQPIEAMGRYAVDALFDQIDRGEAASAASVNSVFAPTLVPRESSQPAEVTTPPGAALPQMDEGART